MLPRFGVRVTDKPRQDLLARAFALAVRVFKLYPRAKGNFEIMGQRLCSPWMPGPLTSKFELTSALFPLPSALYPLSCSTKAPFDTPPPPEGSYQQEARADS